MIYDLALPAVVPDFHQRYCGPSLKGKEAITASGTPETLSDTLRRLRAETLELSPK